MRKQELIAHVARSVAGEVVAIDAGALVPHLSAAAVHEVESGELARVPECDAAVVGGLGGATPLEVARALSGRVRPGGSVIFAVPTTRAGIKGAAGSIVGLLRRKKPVLLEDLCESLLVAGFSTIEAFELDDPAGTSVVTAQAGRGQYST